MLTRINVLLAALLVLFSLGLVTSQHRARELFIAVERAQAHAVAHEVRWNQLQVEQTEYAKAALIDSRAQRELGMQSVASDRILHLSVDPVTHAVSLSQPWRENEARARSRTKARSRTGSRPAPRAGAGIATAAARPGPLGAVAVRASTGSPAKTAAPSAAPLSRPTMKEQP